MFNAEDIKLGLALGQRRDPSFINIRRLVKNNAMRIENLVQSIDRTVKPENVLITVLSTLNLNADMDYETVEWRAMRACARIGNSEGFTSVGHYGRVFNSTVIEGQDEIISLVAKPINPNIPYQRMIPLKFMYHPYVNLDWAIGTSYVADDITVLELNIVSLAWQYVKYLRTLRGDERKLSMVIYIYRYVVYRTLPSYFNLAVYNRHINYNDKVDVPNYTTSREFRVPNVEELMEKHVEVTANYFRKGNMLPVEILNNINFLYDDLNAIAPTAVSIIPDTTGIRTYQHMWLYILLKFKFAGDMLRYNHTAADKYKPNLKRGLQVFKQRRAVDKMPKHLSLHINRFILDRLEKLL